MNLPPLCLKKYFIFTKKWHKQQEILYFLISIKLSWIFDKFYQLETAGNALNIWRPGISDLLSLLLQVLIP